MTNVRSFKEIRQDGKVIDEHMSTDEIVALEWAPEKIVRIEWFNDGKKVQLENKKGILAELLPDRSGVAVLMKDENCENAPKFLILNSDKTVRSHVENTQEIFGCKAEGSFVWFEPSRQSDVSSIGVIFRRSNDNQMFHLDVSSVDGRVLNTYPVR